MAKLQIVVGGQFGSEAKGAIAGYLAESLTNNDLAVRVAGPNAGHTVVDQQGETWKLRQVPVAAVTSHCKLWIAPGSEIDLEVLHREVTDLDAAGFGVQGRIAVAGSATIIDDEHKETERTTLLTERLGSTAKGIGAARAARLMRTAVRFQDLHTNYTVNSLASDFLRIGNTVQVEGTQGFGLGLHTDYYPKCTSSDATAVDFAAMAHVSPWLADEVEVWVVFRPYPIRVAGNSGPLAGETTWENLGLPVERTTVTNKVRRVGSWQPDLVRRAIDANGGYQGAGYAAGRARGNVHLAMAMADHVDQAVYGEKVYEKLTDDVRGFVSRVESQLGYPVELIGTSPSTVVDRRV